MQNNCYLILARKYMVPNIKKILVLYITVVLSHILSLLPIYYMGKIINYVTDKNFQRILYTIIILCIIFLINAIFSIAETYLTNWLNNEITKTIKDDIYCKATNINIIDFQNLSVGHIISLIEGDASMISEFFVTKFIGIIVSIITLFVSMGFLFKLSTSLTVIALISFPLGFLGSLLFATRINKKSEILRKVSDDNYNFLNKTLSGIKEVKAYVIEQNMWSKFKIFTEEIKKNSMKICVLEIISGMFNTIISSISEWIIIGYGTWRIIKNTFSIGSYVAFNGYLNLLFSSVKELLNVNIMFKSIDISFERIFCFLNMKDEKSSRMKKMVDFNNDIIFAKVSFTYSNNSEYILNELSTKFRKKTMSVIVGKNGAGKSTLLALIEQFYKPIGGNIYIGNTNLGDIDLNFLRNNISMVQQHPMILEGTLKENLLYGNKVINDEYLDKVCIKVGLKKWISTLKDGYNTYIGEISGGQQQRIAIARALIKDAPILLLDEITSDLDGETENEIIKLLNELSKEKTIILISHRLNAIMNIPNIYVMEYGKIVAQGSHEYLLKNSLLYNVLVSGKE